VTAAEATVEVAMLPGMIEVEATLFAAVVMPDPFAVVVNVRGFGMALPVAKTGCGPGNRAVNRRRTMFRDERSTHRVAASFMALRQSRERKNQGDRKN
jgi:hypothetical protein